MRSVILALVFACALVGAAQAKCNAKFLNPITEICWDCIFPISIGAISLGTSRPDTRNQAFPLCACWFISCLCIGYYQCGSH